jgi:hypothetical protein
MKIVWKVNPNIDKELLSSPMQREEVIQRVIVAQYVNINIEDDSVLISTTKEVPF